MTEKQKQKKVLELLTRADEMMHDALCLCGKNRLFVEKVVSSQLELGEAIIYLNPKQTILKKSS